LLGFTELQVIKAPIANLLKWVDIHADDLIAVRPFPEILRIDLSLALSKNSFRTFEKCENWMQSMKVHFGLSNLSPK
jgi:hypothetical protein